MQYHFDEIINRKGTGCEKWDGAAEAGGNPDALPMWVADTDFRCPTPVVEAVTARAAHGIFGYCQENPRFQQVTAQWQRERHGWDIGDGTILFSSSVVPAIFTAVQAFTQPGDKVIVQRPVYYPFMAAVEDQGRMVSNNALILKEGHYEIDFDDLERRASDPDAKLMILCSPHNPVSRVFTRDELTKIGSICRKHDVVLFSDEIHGDIVFQGHRHIPIASISSEIAQICLTAVSPSKTFNVAGLRAAAVIIHNPELLEKFQIVLRRNRSASLSVFGQAAYIAAYGHCADYADQLVAYLQENVAYLQDFLEDHMPKIHLIRPEGTYLMWLDCRELGLEDEALEHFFAWDAGLALDMGSWFGPEGSGFARMNIACPKAYLQQAMRQLLAAYSRLS